DAQGPGIECVLFGRAPASRRVYYAVKRAHAPIAFWTAVPGLDVGTIDAIVGTTIHQDADADARKVFLFLKATRDGRPELVCHVLSLPYDAARPPSWADGNASVLDTQRTDRWNVLVALTDSWSLPPCLVLWGADGYEVRSVDTAGTDWASADTLPAGEIRGD